ncbi:MAG: S-layer homology domain-containing protein [Anaerolineales bacterium]|nr:S-layer homology domain-containing protein [Anaerolineales bacterium]
MSTERRLLILFIATAAGLTLGINLPLSGITHAASPTVWYVRPNGGSPEQCTGRVNAPYPGSGTIQPCAWDHPFRALPPGGTPRITGGDTLIIASGSYMMGYGASGAENCDYEGSYDCLMSSIPSGPDASHPTRILGAGWDSGCTNPPELWGTGRPRFIVNLTDSSNVEVACLEITDHSSCIEDHLFPTGGSQYTCQRDNPPYGDWAATGLYAEDSANLLLKDLNIHGLANTGVLAGRLTDWTVDNVRIAGNGLAGWNGDLVGDGTNSENHGTLIFRHWVVEWNGCGETYPDKQYVGCWGQEAGGYGDGAGFGGTTGGHYIIEDSAFLHNTSDGLDMLYTRLPDAVIEIRRTIAEGNDGNQIKTTGAVTIENSIIVSNCGFFHDMPYWNNDDDCRAGGSALVFALNPGGQAKVINSTVTGEGGCLASAECALDKTCNGSEKVLIRNVIFQGQKIFFNPEEDTCFAWYDDESSPPMPANPFVVDYSLITGVRFGNVTPCPGPHNLCDVLSDLMNMGIDAFDAHLLPGSPAINAGTTSGAPLNDFDGRLRDSQPDIGAYEYGSTSTFGDVPATHWAWSWINRLYASGITTGCSTNPLMYCPENSVTRAQMAIFLERGMNGPTYTPPPGTGTVFTDVPLSYWAVNWIEKLYVDGITTGCGTSPLVYCPEQSVTRAQMAIFLLRARHGATYTPPAVGGSTGFNDVSTGYWAAAWIKQLAVEGITTGCGSGNYCPEDSVTRAQMAVFLVRTFNLP